RLVPETFVVDAANRRVGGQVLADAAGVEDLRDEEDVGDGRRIAVTEAPGFRRVVKHPLDRGEVERDPVAAPFGDLVLGNIQLFGKIRLRAAVVERMNFAGDVERYRSHAGAAGGIARQD